MGAVTEDVQLVVSKAMAAFGQHSRIQECALKALSLQQDSYQALLCVQAPTMEQ